MDFASLVIIAGPLCDLCGANVASDSEGIKKNQDMASGGNSD